jgi:hypothetical protein
MNKVPLWVFQQSFGTFGSRMPQRPVTIDKGAKNCAKCNVFMPTFRERNYWYNDKQDYCDVCIVGLRREDTKKFNSRVLPGVYTTHAAWVEDYGDDDFRRSMERDRDRLTIAQIPKGNLDEQDYRFWIGKKESVATFAVCRACGTEVWGGPGAMLKHKEVTNLFKGGGPCTTVLVQCYTKLLAKRQCIVCQAVTYNKRWGIPLCTPECLMKWKFYNREWYLLAMELKEFFPTNEERAKLFVVEKSGGSTVLEST